MFEGDIGVDYHAINQGKKKPYYDNMKQKEFINSSDIGSISEHKDTIKQLTLPLNSSKIIGTTINPNVIEKYNTTSLNQILTSPEPIRKEVGKSASLFTGNNLLDISSKQISQIMKMKEKANFIMKKDTSDGKMVIMKLGHKQFKNYIQEFTNILNNIIASEQNYGKAMNSIGIKKSIDIFTLNDGLIFTSDFVEGHFISVDSFSVLEKHFLKEKFSEQLFKKDKINLPDWKDIKQTINLVGQIHVNCSKYLTKGAIGTINMMNVDYNEKYLELKKEKKKIIKELEECHSTFLKIKNEYEALQKQLESQLSEYQDLLKKKEESSVILKQEMKVRLIKGNLDSMKNKLADADDKYKECKSIATDTNDKIQAFLKQWKAQREIVCQNTLRTVITICEENYIDAEKAFEFLITNFNTIVEHHKGNLCILEVKFIITIG